MKNLPIGEQNFAKIVKKENNFFYADKTELLYQIVRLQIPYFLSRPRRFGKTLLVSTLEHILRGNRDMFKGLWIDDSDYDWTPYPVIRLDMSSITASSPEKMEASLLNYMSRIGIKENVDISKFSDLPQAFSSLIELIYLKYKNTDVAILIDEYDAPIVSNLDQPPLAETIRKNLAEFYGAIKASSNYTGHIFITGISRFTKASLFSKLNNLKDLTLNPNFSDICGINESEFNILFNDRQEETLKVLKANGTMLPHKTNDDLRKLIMSWYDGYSWDGKTKVLNPCSLFSFFDEFKIGSYWFATGTPSFLKKFFASKSIKFDMLKEPVFYDETWNEIDEIDQLDPFVLLFQTGYITVKEVNHEAEGPNSYQLCLPNLEVKSSLVPLLLSIKPPKNPLLAKIICDEAFDCLFKLDTKGFQDSFKSYWHQYAYDDYQYNENEGFYRALFKAAMYLAGQQSQSEGHTGEGRYDTHIKDPEGNHFIIELKYVNSDDLKVDQEQEGLPHEKTKSKKSSSEKKEAKQAKLKEAMAEQAKVALTQIEKKYQAAFFGGNYRVYKVALVVAGRTDTLAVIQEAKR
jgi:hypothetical protein